MDLNLYTIYKNFLNIKKGEEYSYLTSSPLERECTDAEETLANKVVKFMLTLKGSDVLEPAYGAEYLDFASLSEQLLGKLQIIILDDLSNCKDYIQNNTPATSVRLSALRLLKLEYNREQGPEAIHIFIEIKTDKGNTIPIDFPLLPLYLDGTTYGEYQYNT